MLPVPYVEIKLAMQSELEPATLTRYFYLTASDL